MNQLVKWIDFPPLGDHRGSLVAVESHQTVPFEIKRVFYIFNTLEGVTRGMHAHLAVKQVMLCVTGSCKILLDDGFSRESVILDSPTKGLFLESLIWREMSEFSPDCVLLVIASEHYNEDEYIRNYDNFKKSMQL